MVWILPPGVAIEIWIFEPVALLTGGWAYRPITVYIQVVNGGKVSVAKVSNKRHTHVSRSLHFYVIKD